MATTMIFLVLAPFVRPNQETAPPISVDEIVAAAVRNRQLLENVQLELFTVQGDPARNEVTDHLRIIWAGTSGLQILDRKIIRNGMPFTGEFVRRIASYTDDFAFVFEKTAKAAEWRVSNTMLRTDQPLSHSSKFSRVDMWHGATTTVDGIPVEDLLIDGNVKSIVRANDGQSVLVNLLPPTGVFGHPVSEIQIVFSLPAFVVTETRFVYTAQPPGGPRQHIISELVGTELHEWEYGIFYPRSIQQSSTTVADPRLDADALQVNFVSIANVVSLRTGHVESLAFLPSTFGMPNHIVGVDAPKRVWNWWLILLLAANVLVIGTWLFHRFRKTAY
jgi:hypothetical protein